MRFGFIIFLFKISLLLSIVLEFWIDHTLLVITLLGNKFTSCQLLGIADRTNVTDLAVIVINFSVISPSYGTQCPPTQTLH